MIAISTALNEFRLNAVNEFLACGSQSARADIYDGLRPALGGVPTGTRLASISLMNPLGIVTNGLLSISMTNEALITNTGQATWARIVNGNDVVAWDCDVTDLNGSGELRLSSTTLYAGGYTRIVSGLLG